MKDVLGRNIKFYRDRIGLSQEVLAARVGLSKSAIGLIEVGKSWPIHDNLVAIAQVLETSDRDLLSAADPVVLKPTLLESWAAVGEALKGLTGAASKDPLLARLEEAIKDPQTRKIVERELFPGLERRQGKLQLQAENTAAETLQSPPTAPPVGLDPKTERLLSAIRTNPTILEIALEAVDAFESAANEGESGSGKSSP